MADDPFDPFLNLRTTVDVCPLCGERHENTHARVLENDPEGWMYEIDCPTTGKSYKAKPTEVEKP